MATPAGVVDEAVRLLNDAAQAAEEPRGAHRR